MKQRLSHVIEFTDDVSSEFYIAGRKKAGK